MYIRKLYQIIYDEDTLKIFIVRKIVVRKVMLLLISLIINILEICIILINISTESRITQAK